MKTLIFDDSTALFMVFSGSDGSNMHEKPVRERLPAATWLQERLGRPLGLDFWAHFWGPKPVENDTENNLFFECFWGGPGNRGARLRGGYATPFGPGSLARG